jgi:2C-methyl-D-erythritol 2,4-cyclodiphosphate synthase
VSYTQHRWLSTALSIHAIDNISFHAYNGVNGKHVNGTDMEFDQLNELLARMTKELQEKRKESIRIADEIMELQQKINSAEETRAMLVGTRPSVNVSALSLQDVLLKRLESLGQGNGMTMLSLVDALRYSKHPKSDSKSFYATVFTTVKRLVGKGKVEEYVDPEAKQKLYRLTKREADMMDENEGVSQ